MTVPESRRHELYTGLHQVLGSELTDTLMAFLPPTPITALATQDDVADLRTDLGNLRTEVGDLRTEVGDLRTEMRTEFKDLRIEFKGDIGLLAQRIDRMQLTLLAGFMSMIVALVAAIFFG